MKPYSLIRPLLFLQDPESAHQAIHWLGRWLGHAPLLGLLRRTYSSTDSRLSQDVFGQTFANPIGAAAGFDKPGELSAVLQALGFAFSEVGAVTPKPQPGNDKPRLFRLPSDHAIINRMGFNNDGLEPLRKNLKDRPANFIIGVNIGKNKATPNEQALDDYRQCVEQLADRADFFVVNVSSPNTPNLRELQDKEPLRRILQAVMAARPEGTQTPVLLKLAPDLTDGQLNDALEVALDCQLDGLVATNTTVSRAGLVTPAHVLQRIGDGGVSGAPLRQRSTEVIRYLYSHSQGKIPIIGVGGIASAADAYEKITAGATLIQLYTGLIYEGPGLVKRINRGLVELMTRDGHATIAQAVGSKVQ